MAYLYPYHISSSYKRVDVSFYIDKIEVSIRVSGRDEDEELDWMLKHVRETIKYELAKCSRHNRE